MLKDFFLLAAQSIMHRRMRSWLTVIGVFIGITAVVALISIGLGLERTITDQVSSVFGVDTFFIMNEDTFGPRAHGPGGADQYALDLATLRAVEGVKVAAALREQNGFVEGALNAEGKAIQGIFPVMGLSPELMTEFESFTGELEAMPGGRLFEPGDVEVAVLDFEVSQRLGVGVGDTIFIAGAEGAELNVTVIGIMTPSEQNEDVSEGGFRMQFSSSSDGDTIRRRPSEERCRRSSLFLPKTRLASDIASCWCRGRQPSVRASAASVAQPRRGSRNSSRRPSRCSRRRRGASRR